MHARRPARRSLWVNRFRSTRPRRARSVRFTSSSVQTLAPQLNGARCQFRTSEVRQEEDDAFATPGETYLILSQTRTPTPSRPSIGLLFGAVRIVRVSPSTLKNRT